MNYIYLKSIYIIIIYKLYNIIIIFFHSCKNYTKLKKSKYLKTKKTFNNYTIIFYYIIIIIHILLFVSIFIKIV